MPRITDIICKRNGYHFFTKLNVYMKFYTFLLDKASLTLCTFATPFGMYCYLRLPMGVKISPDIAQAEGKPRAAQWESDHQVDVKS